ARCCVMRAIYQETAPRTSPVASGLAAGLKRADPGTMKQQTLSLGIVATSLLLAGLGLSCSGGGGGSTVVGDGSLEETAACKVGSGKAPVQAPKFLWNRPTDTGWFSSPAIVELSDGTTKKRALVVPTYSIDVFSPTGDKLSHIDAGGATKDRIY